MFAQSSVNRRPLSPLARVLLAPVLFLLFFLPLGAAAQAPMTNTAVASYTGATALGTWTLTGFAAVRTSGCATGDTACIQMGNGDTATSPVTSSLAAATYFWQADCNSPSGSGLQYKQNGASSFTALGCSGANAVWTTPQFTTTSTSSQSLVLSGSSTPQDFVGNIVLYRVVTPGVMNYPSLDLAAISTGVSGFFGFLSPLLWVILGIGVGGIIISRARNLV